jgi:hypothetical protein
MTRTFYALPTKVLFLVILLIASGDAFLVAPPSHRGILRPPSPHHHQLHSSSSSLSTSSPPPPPLPAPYAQNLLSIDPSTITFYSTTEETSDGSSYYKTALNPKPFASRQPAFPLPTPKNPALSGPNFITMFRGSSGYIARHRGTSKFGLLMLAACCFSVTLTPFITSFPLSLSTLSLSLYCTPLLVTKHSQP